MNQSSEDDHPISLSTGTFTNYIKPVTFCLRERYCLLLEIFLLFIFVLSTLSYLCSSAVSSSSIFFSISSPVLSPFSVRIILLSSLRLSSLFSSSPRDSKLVHRDPHSLALEAAATGIRPGGHAGSIGVD